MEIILKYNPDHFRELYYTEGKGDVLTNQDTKRFIFWSLGLLILTLIVYFLALKYSQIIFFVVVVFLIFLLSCFYTIRSLIKYFKWKNSIEKYVKDLSKYKSHSLVLSENAIEYKFDSSSSIEKWNDIKELNIQSDFIFFKNSSGNTSFLIPSKSVESRQYQLLIEFIKSKVM